MNLIMKNYVDGRDFGEVYRLFTDSEINTLIINKPDHNSMNAFAKWLDRKLDNDINDFMVFRERDNNFVGFAYSYDFQALDGHCLFTVAVKAEWQNLGVGGLISIQFLKYLFLHYNLRKVYIHIYSSNKMSLICAEKFGFTLEGVLKDYRYAEGKFVDLKIYSITKKEFLETGFVTDFKLINK